MIRGRRRRPRTAQPQRGGKWVGLALVAPTLAVVVLFTFVPLAIAILSSVSRDRENPGQVPQGSFVGLDNYGRLFGDPDFLQVLTNTAVFVLATVSISVPLALGFALAANRAMRGIAPVRTAFFYPTFLPMVGAGAMWLFLYNLNFGLVNDGLQALGLARQNWLGSEGLALPAIAAMTIWREASYFMIFYLAGLQTLPADVIEAAAIDGARSWQSLRHVVLPLLRPTSLFVTTTAFILSFQTYDQIAVMTKDGGPDNATNMLLFNARLEFGYGHYDLANAQTVLLVVILFVFTALNYVLSERSTTYLGG